MQDTTERRMRVLEYISDRRHVKMQEIANEFGISINTARRDVQILSCSYPLYTEGTAAGGVFAMEGWYLGRRFLHDDQEALLRKLLPGLQPEDQKTMECILTAFAKPTIKEVHR